VAGLVGLSASNRKWSASWFVTNSVLPRHQRTAVPVARCRPGLRANLLRPAGARQGNNKGALREVAGCGLDDTGGEGADGESRIPKGRLAA
jgi:hypothetical protein